MNFYVPDKIAGYLIDVLVESANEDPSRYACIEPAFLEKFKVKYSITTERLEQYFEELVANGYLVNTAYPGTGIGMSFTITQKAVLHHNT
jgi:hypothetical protein